jgi:hypothetical protein
MSGLVANVQVKKVYSPHALLIRSFTSVKRRKSSQTVTVGAFLKYIFFHSGYVARDALRLWHEKNHRWLELSDVHRETTEDIRVTAIPFYMGTRVHILKCFFLFNFFLSFFLFIGKGVFKTTTKDSRTPLYEHLVNTTTSLLRPLFCSEKKNANVPRSYDYLVITTKILCPNGGLMNGVPLY